MSAMGEARPLVIGFGVGAAAIAVIWALAYALGAPEEIYGTLGILGSCIGVLTCLALRDRQLVAQGRSGPRGKRPARRS